MSGIMIVTDSVSSISSSLGEQCGVRVIPAACIVFDGKYYPDGEGISAEEAYALVQKDPDKFSTSPHTPAYLLEVYRRLSEESRNIIVIHFSSAVSAAYNIACSAAGLLKEEKPDCDIRIVDSKTVASGQGLLAVAAARAAAAGANMDAICEFIIGARRQTECFMLLDTLKYVYRTGRYSKTTARIASLLQVKPLNHVTAEGTFEVTGKVTRRKDGFRKLLETIRAQAPAAPLNFMICHSSAPELAEEFAGMLRGEFDCRDILISEYSPIMGYASGPRCLVVGYQPELTLPV